MKVELLTEENGVLILTLEGRMDASTCQDFDSVSVTLPSDKQVRIVVDLAKLEFISSAGLRSFLTLGKVCQKNGQKLVFCSLNKMVTDVFKVSGFTSIFSIQADRASALSSL